ncbi:MAG TPA: MoxR family ATPase [Chitinophagales bacterium]|nr:MoxR family ATPase [Chitinophagales bacterium]HNE47290.1 MoxR family ATPase [Chitinophagales bacterium]HNJ90586.1 MoxR family ATPase [Chitinophagales bacterium]HNK98902.1 MoxR family ATPase [Chitinophagales bacterium]HNM08414.1 MoxR family ATPase [Chitinophagales bacterium]
MEENFVFQETNPEIQQLQQAVYAVRAELSKVIIGQQQMMDLLIAGLLAGGHILIEGVPGIAKTLTAKMLAQTVAADFSRIQFTPDLMPTDVLGTSVFNQKTTEFNFRKGPIFSNIVLIDEINRSPAKTQAALLEVMEELKVTMDGETYPMTFPFFVIATQNPIEQEGTYKLPEAQLDRFMFRIKITYPDLDQEKQILYRFKEDFTNRQKDSVQRVMSVDDLKRYRNTVEHIHIKNELLDYIAQIVFKTRNHGDLFLGASPRASINIMKASKAVAAMNGRNFVTPDDIHFVAYAVLNHRIILTPDKELEGYDSAGVIKTIIESIDVPR